MTDPSSLYGLYGTLATLIAGIITLYIQQQSEFKKARDAREASRVSVVKDSAEKGIKLDQIHVLVNSRLEEALKRIDALEKLVALLIDPNTKVDTAAAQAIADIVDKVKDVPPTGG